MKTIGVEDGDRVGLPGGTGLRRVVLGVILLLMVAAVAARTRVATTILDDTYIFCRYAANLAHGHGLVWNPGDAPVEGFTSPLWVALLALGVLLGADPVYGAAVLATAAFAGVAYLVWWLGERLRPREDGLNLAGAFAVAFSACGIFWSGTGMDEPLFALAVLVAVAGSVLFGNGELGTVPYSVVLVLLCLARPEGLAVAGVLLGSLIVTSGGDRRCRALRATSVVAALMVTLFAARWLYFHAPLPNTYYAKTGGGLLQLRAGLAYAGANWAVWLPGLLAGAWIVRKDRRYLPLLLTAAVLTAAIVLEGGDQFGRARFFLPVFPLTVLLAAGLIPRARRRTAAGLAWLLAISSLWLWSAGPAYREIYRQAAAGLSAWHGPWKLVTLPRPPDPEHAEFLEDLETGFVVMGKTLARVAPRGSSIAVVPIGAIGWYSGLRVIDMVGLVNPAVAHAPVRLEPGARWRPGHNRGDGAAILRLRPDFIQLQDALSSRPAPRPHPFMLRYTSVAEIWNSPEFWAHYEFYPIRTTAGWYYNLYRRKK